MFVWLSLLLALQTQSSSAETCSRVSPGEFSAWLNAARGGELAIPDKVSRKARHYRYVFVRGFHNEQMPGYFALNVKELRAHDVPRRAVHFISPSSHETPAGNAELVRSRFLEIARQGPEKLVVIAHSRGACDSLAFALKNPEFVADHIQALFLIQGPFGGTGVADYLMGEGPRLDFQMPWRQRLVAYLLGRFEVYRLNRGKHGGIPSLTRRASAEFWQRTLAEHRAAISVVAPKTFYVTTQTKPSRLRLVLRATASYLSTYFGPNDGLVALDDQALPGVGTVLAVLDAGHTDLTNRLSSSRSQRRLQRALIDAIIMTVGASEPPR